MSRPLGADIAPLLDNAARRLRGAGIDNARAEARWLLASALGQTRISEWTAVALTAGQQAAFDTLVQRRATREPLQYILGRAAFRWLDLRVGPGVFIPRPETERLVELVLNEVAGIPQPVVIDLCSGSGAIALAVASEAPTVRVVAVERSRAALRWLSANRDEQSDDVRTRVQVVAGDVEELSAEPARGAGLTGASADVVVANPPYVPLAAAVGPEVRHDPPEAVFGGPTGLALVPALSRLARHLLRVDGLLAMEHDETTAAAVATHLRNSGWRDVATVPDLAGRPRFATARRPPD